MADLEIQSLREKNNEMVQKLQHWKMTAAQKENEKLGLMKENNDLRLKFARLRNGEAAHIRKLNSEMQSASEEALSFLVQASDVVARMLQLFKTYMQDRQELESSLPRWSTMTNTPTSEKVNRVRPTLIGGRHMQPVVSLSRTLQVNPRPVVSRSPNQQNIESTVPMQDSAGRSPSQESRSTAHRAVPLRMLQDVFIPLTRIDAELPVNVETHMADDSNEEMASDDSGEQNGPNMSTDSEDFDDTQRLEAVIEEPEVETPPRSVTENPMEGPSWLLDAQNTQLASPLSVRVEYTPTVRRRKREHAACSPASARRASNSGRILKVLVAKLRLDGGDHSVDVSPPKRANRDDISPRPKKIFHRRAHGSPKHQDSPTMRSSMDASPAAKRVVPYDAPSPNGSTDSRFDVFLDIVKSPREPEPCGSGVLKPRTSNLQPTPQTSQMTPQPSEPTPQTSQMTPQTNQLTPQTPQTSQPSSSIDNQPGPANSDNYSYTTESRSSRPITARRDTHNTNENSNSRYPASDSRDSDSSGSDLVSEGRTRRPRKAVVYKEKPLNRKLRR